MTSKKRGKRENVFTGNWADMKQLDEFGIMAGELKRNTVRVTMREEKSSVI